MGLGNVFSRTWKDYKVNFLMNIKVMLVFYILPAVLFGGILIWLAFSSGLFSDFMDMFGQVTELQTSVVGGTQVEGYDYLQDMQLRQQKASALFFGFLGKALWFILLAGVLWILIMFLQYYGYLAIYAPALKKKGKYGFKDALRESKPYYWRTIGLFIILSLVTLGIYFLGIILSIFTFGLGLLAAIVVLIWLMVLWMFAPFVIVDMNKGVFESLSGSWKIVKGRWWRSFGYVLLVSVIVGAIYYALALIAGLIGGALFFFSFNDLAYSMPSAGFDGLSSEEQIAQLNNQLSGNYFSELISGMIKLVVFIYVITMVYMLFALPYWLLFVKNSYQEFKKEKRN